MRLVVIGHTAGMAGAELALAESIQYLESQGHQVFLVLPEDGPYLPYVKPLLSGHKIIRQDHWAGQGSLTPLQKIKFVRGFYLSAKAIERYIQEVKPDLVLTNTSVIPVGAWAAQMASVPHVWLLHEFVKEDHGLTWQYGEALSYSLIDRCSTLVLTVSEALRSKVSRFIPPEKVRLLYGAIEVDWHPFQPNELPVEPILLIAGAIHAGKNQELAIRALAEPSLMHIGASLRIIGAGPEVEKSRLRELAARLGVAERVEFIPFNQDRRWVFAQGRALIVASRAEAFGRVTVEAQKSGLPVLAAYAGASPEIIEHGINGLLFDINSPADLAIKAFQLLQDSTMHEEMRQRAIVTANQSYGLAHHGTQLIQYLQEAIDTYGRRR